MLQVNEYFEGAVKSIAVNNSQGNATAGVINTGDYKFGTASIEYMTITHGSMSVKIEGESEWKTFSKDETFKIEKDSYFEVKASEPISYMCRYE